MPRTKYCNLAAMELEYILISIMHLSLILKPCISANISIIMAEDSLPNFHGMELAGETDVATPLLCGRECLKFECHGFLMKTTDDYVEDDHCYSTHNHDGYTGTLAVTINGNICQNWADQTPHIHPITPDQLPEGNYADAKNYCRDPDGQGFNWCYTINPDVLYEACDTYKCFQNVKCRLFATGNGQSGYREKAGYRYFSNKSAN